MKFIIAKKDGIKCNACEAEIMRGENMVLTFFKTPSFKKVLTYHVPCYMPWYQAMFNRKYSEWKSGTGNTERPKRGRPPIYTDPTKEQKLNTLRANLCYHKKLGHITKVKILEGKITKLI